MSLKTGVILFFFKFTNLYAVHIIWVNVYVCGFMQCVLAYCECKYNVCFWCGCIFFPRLVKIFKRRYEAHAVYFVWFPPTKTSFRNMTSPRRTAVKNNFARGRLAVRLPTFPGGGLLHTTFHVSEASISSVIVSGDNCWLLKAVPAESTVHQQSMSS